MTSGGTGRGGASREQLGVAQTSCLTMSLSSYQVKNGGRPWHRPQAAADTFLLHSFLCSFLLFHPFLESFPLSADCVFVCVKWSRHSEGWWQDAGEEELLLLLLHQEQPPSVRDFSWRNTASLSFSSLHLPHPARPSLIYPPPTPPPFHRHPPPAPPSLHCYKPPAPPSLPFLFQPSSPSHLHLFQQPEE